MINPIRERIWYVKAFLLKYIKQILISLAVTIAIVMFGKVAISKIPQTRPHYRIGIVGQFGAGQLPPYIINYLNAGLIGLDSKQEPQAQLAEKWSISDDGKVYTFFLKPNLKWFSGEKVRSSDIKISIPNIQVETVDPNIIKFQIPTRFSPFLSLLNMPLLNSSGKTIGEYDIHLKQKSSGVISQIILESSKKVLVFNVFATPKQALTAFKLGQVDLVLNLPSEYQAESKDFGKTRTEVDTSHVVILVFNQQDPNLKEKSTRQAIAYSIKDKVFGQTEALTTISPISWAFNPLVKTYPHNPQKAKDLIKTPISLELATTPELLSTAEALKKQLDSDLLSLNIKVITSTPEQFQLLLTSYTIPADPDQYRDWHSTQSTNIGRGTDEKIDKLLEDGRVTQDSKERKQIYFDFQKTFSEELPALVLYHPAVFDLARKDTYFNIIKSN